MQGGDWKEMFAAIQHGNHDLVEYYLKQGIDPNYQHPEYLAAPLVESIRFNQLSITKLLLEHGANPEIKEVMGGDTPFSVAKANKNKELLKLLKTYSDNSDQEDMQQIQANGLEFDCRVAGESSGELVVLLHGFPETSYMYHKLMQDLGAEGYYCIAPDLRGYSPGARPKGKKHYTIDKLASDVLEIARSTGKTKFHLVGHDWGSAIGWKVAHDAPEQLLSWTAISVPHPQSFFETIATNPDQKRRSRYMRLFQIPFLPELQIKAKDFRLFRKAWRPHSDAEVDQYVSVMKQKGATRAMLDYYRANYPLVKQATQKQLMGDIHVPTLFIWGKKDFAIGPVAVEGSHAFMKSEYTFLELDGSHWLVQSNYGEVKAAIHEHLGRHFAVPD